MALNGDVVVCFFSGCELNPRLALADGHLLADPDYYNHNDPCNLVHIAWTQSTFEYYRDGKTSYYSPDIASASHPRRMNPNPFATPKPRTKCAF
jgi:hypothetical protein